MVKRGCIDELFAVFAFLRFRCRHDLYWLGTRVLGYGTKRVDERFHRWFCKELQVEQDTLYLLPRDHTKSTWGIAIKVVQDVLRNPNHSILLGSLTASLSVNRLRTIRRHLEHPFLTALFPEILSPNPELDSKSTTSVYKSIRWTNDAVTVLRQTSRTEATIEIAGTDVYRTGRHYDRIYLDDIINEMTVQSDTKSDRALEFLKFIIPMATDECVLRIYGTIYDPADIYHWLMDKTNYEDDEFKIDLRVIKREVLEDFETAKKYYDITKRQFNKEKVRDPEDKGWKMFIYTFFDLKYLRKKRAWLESDYIFNCQYRYKVIGMDERVFPPPYQEVDELPDGLQYYMTVDPAFVVSRYSDYSAIIICGYDKSDHIYVAAAERHKVPPDKLLERIYTLDQEYQCEVIGIEKGAWTTVLEWAYEHATQRRDWVLPIVHLALGQESNAKDNRIQGLSYFFKREAVILKSGLDDLKNELYRYPGNSRSKDDLLDALSMQRELIAWKKDGRATVDRDRIWRLQHKNKPWKEYFHGYQPRQRSYTSY